MPHLNRKISQSFVASLIIHGVILLVLGAYLVTQTQKFQDLFDASILSASDPPKPAVRKPVVKPIIKPMLPAQSTVVVEQIQPIPRATTTVSLRTASVSTDNIIEFSNRPLKIQAPLQPHRPKVVDPNQPIPEVVTHVDLPTSSAPGALAFAGPAPGGRDGGMGKSIQRGISGAQDGVGLEVMPQIPGVASLLGATDAIPNALDALIGEMRLGNQLVIPMKSNELGARIYTHSETKMPTGYFQVCYVRFRRRVNSSPIRHDITTLHSMWPISSPR